MAGVKKELKERLILLDDFGIEITKEIKDKLTSLKGDELAQERYCHDIIKKHLDAQEERILKRKRELRR